MKKLSIVLILLLFLVSCNKRTDYKEYVVTADRVLIRVEPNTTSTVLGVVNYGDTVYVNENYSNIEYAEIKYNDKKAFLKKSYLKIKN